MFSCLALMPRFVCVEAKCLLLVCVIAAAGSRAYATENCVTIHGRAHYYCGDANLRIWHIGTHPEFEPDESSFDHVIEWLEAGVKESAKQELARPDGTVNLYADFLVCPTEPFKKGAVQHAVFKSATNRRYVSGK